MDGWIKLHRVITTKDIYLKPPLYLRTFERMILEANHVCKRIPYNKTTKLIRRGERLTSIRQIAEWVAWYERGILKVPNPKTIKEILGWLIDNEMIEIYNQGNTKETHYNIVNYSVYQAKEDGESNCKVTVNGGVNKQQMDINKNVKKEKNDKKNIYSADFEEFCTIYPNLFNKSATYKNWQALIKKGVAADTIMIATKNYIRYLKDNGIVDPTYITRSTNFLGQKAVYGGYIEYCGRIINYDAIKGTSKFDKYIKDGMMS
ncbi:MAG: IBBPl23 49 [Clostridia bacterium]|jgi:hypothetical protein|nr:IBBPl23 49 [Clostridia bacterium]